MRRGFTVYRYELQLDNEVKSIEKPFQIDYKQTIAKYKEMGYNKVWITSKGKYYWSE